MLKPLKPFFRARTGATMDVCVYGRSLAKTLAQGSQLSILEIDDSKSNIKRVNVRGYTNGVTGFSIIRSKSRSAPVLAEGSAVLNHERILVDRDIEVSNEQTRKMVLSRSGSIDFKIGNVELAILSLAPTSLVATADGTVVIISDAGTEACLGKSIND